VKPDAVREKETERVCGKKRVNAVKLFLRPWQTHVTQK
jgi:hypothetical protein